MKFGTKLGNDKLYCVIKNQPHIAYQSLYSSIFLSLLYNFLLQISQLLFEPGSLNFVYMMRTTKCIIGKKTKELGFIFALFFYFFPFSIFHSKVMDMEIFVKDISGTT